MRTIARIFKRRPGYVGAHRPDSPLRPLGPQVDPWPLAPLSQANYVTGEPAVWDATVMLHIIVPCVDPDMTVYIRDVL